MGAHRLLPFMSSSCSWPLELAPMHKMHLPSFSQLSPPKTHPMGSPSCSLVSFIIIQTFLITLPFMTDIIVGQLTGITFGLSISGAVFINTATSGLHDALPQIPVEELSHVVAGASNQVFESLSLEQRSRALEIIVQSWNKTFICVYVAAAASLISSVFFKVSKHLKAVWGKVMRHKS